jgi:hypothetical protein
MGQMVKNHHTNHFVAIDNCLRRFGLWNIGIADDRNAHFWINKQAVVFSVAQHSGNSIHYFSITTYIF